MALMSEERRKEMEEEMSRFELEIAVPGGAKSGGSKPLSPPPPPPAVAVLIPEVSVLAKPPPPPPSSSPPPPLHVVLRPPPPPPPVQVRPSPGPMRFIPHQLHRQPAPRQPMRHNFVPMRELPMGGHPGHFPSPNSVGPFGPHMGQGPHMHHMHGPMHGPMHMPPGPMQMPHQMGNMNPNLPMPPGFCPPTGPGPMMAPGTGHPGDHQPFMPGDMNQGFEPPVSIPASSNDSPIVVAAPAIYAAPFVKSHTENASDASLSTNGQDIVTSSASLVTAPKTEKMSAKSEEHVVAPTTPVVNSEEVVVSRKKEKKKKIVRMAGGQAWEDNSLLDWESDDFRIFCGDLGNDVTDEVLIRAFSKYPSFVKAKVIRDKRTNKTKGYGFVSFKDPQDFIKAMREMNGKYVGSRPIKLRKSTWRDRNIDLVKKKQREKEKLGLL